MARRKRSDSGGSDAGAWLNTYADMVTLLLTFFILLFSMSTLDAAKFNMIVRAFRADTDSSDKIIIDGEGEMIQGESTGEEITPDEVVDLDDIYRYLNEYIASNNLENSVRVAQSDGLVFIQFMDNMLFEPNSSRLKDSDLEILNYVGQAIKMIENQVELIRVDGHTAALPEYPNYEVSDRILSSERANRVLMYFEDDVGIASEKLVQVAFGKQVPLPGNENQTEAERSVNRRVEIIISTDNILADQLENVYEQLIE